MIAGQAAGSDHGVPIHADAAAVNVNLWISGGTARLLIRLG